jgi:exosortase
MASPSQLSAGSIPRESMRRAAPSGNAPWRSPARIQLIAIGALLVLGQLPLLVKFLEDLWTRPEYQFFPVAIAAAGYIAWERFRDAPSRVFARGSLPITLALLAASWIILSGGLLYVRWMAPVSAWLILAAVVWWAGGWKLTRLLMPGFVLLLVCIPPPGHYDELLGNHLRELAVRASGRILDFAWVPHIVSGTVIEIPGHRLLVEEACSGMNSLMSVLAFTLLYGFWQRRTPRMIAILALAAAGFVICTNVVRITAGAILVHFWHIDILSGAAHEMLGVLLFAVGLGLVISFDQFLMMVVPARQQSNAPEADTGARSNPPANAPNSKKAWIIWWTAAVAFAVLGIVLQIRVGHAWAASHLSGDARFTLPTELAGWQRVEEEGTLNGRPETLGRKSQFWVYRFGDLTAGVAMDYPFTGFHDATICYASSGWNIQSSGGVIPANGAGEMYYAVRMSKPPMMLGQLLFAQFDERGHTPRQTATAQGNLSHLKFALLLSREKAAAPPTYQIQTLLLGAAPLSAEQQTRVKQLFLAARHELAAQLVQRVEANR